MGSKIIISPRAQKEIIDAIDFYVLHSISTPQLFILELQKSYKSLSLNPFFRIRYKNIRALKLNNYPYSLFFVVNETSKIIKIISCFHNKRNPKRYPKK